ncbi:uncharacterized protein LOC129592344 [Paramacrobiotus metropolitanus]|uniref:uncharacterized protein LOC129592344 n=1 Tax=Paramacrobiotus metropolitanus TaxID=2943436 RepID=UPI0024457AAB|nr:uncharacterized protein LOC129592344 [Paramacrobiotus metropolitanus]
MALYYIFLLSISGALQNRLTSAASAKQESDCSAQQSADISHSSATTASHAPVFPFRTDTLTLDECQAYGAIPTSYLCNPAFSARGCNRTDDDDSLLQPMSRTFIELSCSWHNRTFLAAMTNHLKTVSPNRAVIIELDEKNDTTDPVHSDVIEPVRQQLIALTIHHCVTHTVTSKINAVGSFPYLVRLVMKSCWGLIIKKKDLENMQQLRMVQFIAATIAEMEPYTFTNLKNLQSLRLEEELRYLLKQRADNNSKSIRGNLIADSDVNRIARLHCNCSLAWFRNFLQAKPHLIAEKREGEVYVVGNFISDRVFAVGMFRSVLNVDCAKNVSIHNINAGPKFSYNTGCFDIQC